MAIPLVKTSTSCCSTQPIQLLVNGIGKATKPTGWAVFVVWRASMVPVSLKVQNVFVLDNHIEKPLVVAKAD